MTDLLSRTTRFDLPFLFPGQAQREAIVNEALARVDTAMHPAVEATLSEPPDEPGEGDCYLIAAPASAEWAGHEGGLASFAAGVWQYHKPVAGMRIWEKARGAWAHFDGEAWIRHERPATPEGGAAIDVEARLAVAEILDRLTEAGIFSAG